MSELKNLTDQELSNLLSEYQDKSREIREEISYRRIIDYTKYIGKYVEFYRFDDGIPTYIYIDDMSSRKKYKDSDEYVLHITGHGFCGEFEDYKDMNWFDWSWWKDIDIDVNELRRSKRPSFKEITKEDFIKAFEKFHKTLKESFFEIIEIDETQRNESRGAL